MLFKIFLDLVLNIPVYHTYVYFVQSSNAYSSICYLGFIPLTTVLQKGHFIISQPHCEKAKTFLSCSFIG